MKLRWWQWTLAGIAMVVVLALAVYAFGATLPVAHTATASARVEAPPDRVWALITDPAGFPDWRPDVESVTVVGESETGLIWREALGTGTLTFETEVWDPPHRMTARIVDEGLPFGGTWTYGLEPGPDGTGTVLTITEDGEVYNPLFRFMSRFIFGHDTTIRAYLDAVRVELDDG